MQTARPYSFDDGRVYKLLLRLVSSDATNYWWRAIVEDDTGKRALISEIKSPKSFGKIRSMSTFLERFSSGTNKCGQGPTSIAAFISAKTIYGRPAYGADVYVRRYANCPGYIKTYKHNNDVRVHFN